MWTHTPGSTGSLSAQECLRLLAAPGRGLLNLTRHPLAEPVALHYRLVAPDLVLQPAPEEPLLAALVTSDVILEVDATDEQARAGWHVVLTGRLEATDGGELLLRPTDVTGFRLAPTRTA